MALLAFYLPSSSSCWTKQVTPSISTVLTVSKRHETELCCVFFAVFFLRLVMSWRCSRAVPHQKRKTKTKQNTKNILINKRNKKGNKRSEIVTIVAHKWVQLCVYVCWCNIYSNLGRTICLCSRDHTAPSTKSNLTSSARHVFFLSFFLSFIVGPLKKKKKKKITTATWRTIKGRECDGLFAVRLISSLRFTLFKERGKAKLCSAAAHLMVLSNRVCSNSNSCTVHTQAELVESSSSSSSSSFVIFFSSF